MNYQIILLTVLSTWFSIGVCAQSIRMIDVNQTPSCAEALEGVGPFIYKDVIYYSRFHSFYGNELWQTDGTVIGTRLFFDQAPGSMSSYIRSAFLANDLLILDYGDAGFFSYNGDPNAIPVKIDDRPSTLSIVENVVVTTQTRELMHQYDGSAPSRPHALVNLNGDLLMLGQDGIYTDSIPYNVNNRTYESLWRIKSDQGYAVKIKPLGDGTSARMLGQTDDRMFMAVKDESHGTELWVSDGYQSGTHILADLIPGPSSSDPIGMVDWNGAKYFFAKSQEQGRGLWRTDGTTTGTVQLWGIETGVNYPNNLMPIGENLAFLNRGGSSGTSLQLWITDGTSSGTHILYDLSNVFEYNIIAHENSVYFQLYDITNTSGASLWKMGSTSDSAEMIMDMVEGPYVESIDDHAVDAIGSLMTSFDGKLFFTASDTMHGDEIWISDGTPEGTQMLKDLNPGAGSGFITQYIEFGEYLIFQYIVNKYGYAKLGISDGTSEGTYLLSEIELRFDFEGYVPLAYKCRVPDYGARLLLADDRYLYFTKDDGVAGTELWSVDIFHFIGKNRVESWHIYD